MQGKKQVSAPDPAGALLYIVSLFLRPGLALDDAAPAATAGGTEDGSAGESYPAAARIRACCLRPRATTAAGSKVPETPPARSAE